VKAINRITSSVLLLVVGIVLNFITGNVIVTTIGCFVLGLVLNRSGKKRGAQEQFGTKSALPQFTKSVQKSPALTVPTEGVRCVSCGATVKQYRKYCSECGARMAQQKPAGEETYRPEQITNSLQNIRREDEARYVSSVLDLLLVDQNGKYWSIGAQTSKWYVSDRGRWVNGSPAGPLQLVRGNKAILEKQSAKALTTLRKPTGIKCRFCSAEMESSHTFCSKCGKQVSEAPIRPSTTPPLKTSTCKKCGATVNATKRFCTSCGAQLAT
jgi:predicted amidophosphoribosyltransferase